MTKGPGALGAAADLLAIQAMKTAGALRRANMAITDAARGAPASVRHGPLCNRT